jgi:uncharacterized protein (DUF1800 family)
MMRTTRRTFVRTLGLAGVSAALGGCDSATGALGQLLYPENSADFRPPTGDQIDLATHCISRLTFGKRPGEYARVTSLGVEAFIREQLHPQEIEDRRAEWKANQVESLMQATPELYDLPPDQLLFDLTRYRLLRAIHSKRQLFEVMVDFWTDHLNILAQKGDCKWLKAADDRDVIRPHALGRFRDLIRASALSPAMLIYLDGHDNKVVRPGDHPNENYGRELLELHTLGVNGGYTQKDVMEVARCLSGWTFTRHFYNFSSIKAEFNAEHHDDGEKIVLGNRIEARGGAEDLERVLDIVCLHPSTAKHIAWKLCRRFVADPPPEQTVAETAKVFIDSGGDIRRTLETLFASEAFRDPRHRGLLFKRPMHYVVSALRATDAKTDAGKPIMDYLLRMGHAPFQYPTPDGYPLEEQPWLGTLLWRWNFALGLQHAQLAGTRIDVDALTKKFGSLQAVSAHCFGRAPAAKEVEVLRSSAPPLALVLSSPAFQRC